ncbi:discoidin domain-containing protein [Actinotalea ferrariae]|uniref:discoidin domain-containing protein n=1 Tax=Actinotalea ferrariae TaxID=1386098 RepID=UPI001C8C2DF0|nr:discoidin domain-containing protein [Actinotalea ferrariae]MBX9243860.1 discoidin domain-containing protein [Actinotalea ferrariae]
MRRTVLALATAAAVAVGATAVPTAAEAQRRPSSAPEAQVWVTTVDRSETLQQRDPVAFRRGTSPLTTITVDPTQTFQTMDGFGASITDSSAHLLSDLSPEVREATMRSLFDPDEGIGISFLRQPIGSSDFTAEPQHYSYDDMPPGETDFDLEHFSIAHDEEHILPLLREAKQLNPELTVMATPWGQPAWMKEDETVFGGRLKDDPAIYDAYARYLVRFVEAYAAAGVPIDLLTVQNEPQHRAPDGYPGTDMPVAQQIAVIEALGPLLKKASPRTKIVAYDHNWATHPNDLENTPPGEAPEPDYPYQVLDSRAARWIAGTAFHCYSGDPSAMTALHEAYPRKDIWFTECSGSHGPDDTPEQVFRGTLTWHARTLTIGTPRNWAKSVVNWNIALDEDGGPHLGGCGTCTGLVTVLDDGTVRADAEYYTIGHLSKFVEPGARRIASTSYGTTGWNGQIMDVAFRNPDGSTAVVVHNENDEPRSFAIAVGDQYLEYTLPGGALATFTWPEHRSLRPTMRELPTDGATATASSNPGDAHLAVDGDGSTRWSSGQAQEPGQYLQVDLGRVQPIRRVAVDSGDNLGDYARAWEVEVSTNGRHWRTVATGTGTGQLTQVDLRTTPVRHLRISSTGSAGNWWSIADVRLYR